MKKAVWGIIIGLIVVFLLLFGWRVWHYYRLIQKGANPARAGKELNMVEFADFTCPSSRDASFAVRELLAKYPTQIKFNFRFFPLGDEARQGGKEAALAAACAREQDKFWAYHDKLFQNQKNFTLEDLKMYGQQVGLDENKFNSCLDSKKYQTAVQADYLDGIKAGVTGTPTFFVNGQKVEGAIPLEEWEKALKLKD